jgi:hypothetical protein
MFDDGGSSFTQNHIDVRLVQGNTYFNKPIRGSDRQLLLLPADTTGPFDPEYLPARAPHHTAIFALCLGYTGHVRNLPIWSKAERPAVFPRQAPEFLDGHRRPWLHRGASLHLPVCRFKYLRQRCG